MQGGTEPVCDLGEGIQILEPPMEGINGLMPSRCLGWMQALEDVQSCFVSKLAEGTCRQIPFFPLIHSQPNC